MIILLIATGLLPACGTGNVAAPNDPPLVFVTEPARLVEIDAATGGIVLVEFVASDADNTAQTDILADRDGDLTTTFDQVVIALGRMENQGRRQVVPWNVQGVPAGTHRIFARTSDGIATVTAEASGVVVIGPRPMLHITTPATDQIVSRGGLLEVGYMHDGLPDGFTTLFADADADPNTDADQTLIATVPTDQPLGQEHTLVWDATGSPGTDFRVLALATNGSNPPASAASAGRVRIENLAFARAVGPETGRGIGDLSALTGGGSIVVGSLAGSVVFGAGEANETLLTAQADDDFYIARYAPDGSLDWVRTAGGQGDAVGGAVATLPDGSSVAALDSQRAGYTVVFDRGGPSDTSLAVPPQGIVIARYDAQGTFQSARQFAGSPSRLAVEDLAVLEDGSLFLTGSYGDQATFALGLPSETTILGFGGTDIFTARVDPDGSLAWVNRVVPAGGAGLGSNEGHGISVASTAGVTVTGRFQQSATFGAGEPEETTLVSGAGANQNLFVARYRLDGTLAWARSAPSTSGLNSGLGVATLRDGSAVVTGRIAGDIVFGPGEPTEATFRVGNAPDAFVARYDADGALIWARRLGSPSDDDVGNAVAALIDDSVAVTGTFRDRATLVGSPDLVSLGGADIFVARYRLDGTLAWIRTVGSVNSDVALAIAAFSDGSSVVVGRLREAATFGANDARETTLMPAPSALSVEYLARYNADGGF